MEPEIRLCADEVATLVIDEVDTRVLANMGVDSKEGEGREEGSRWMALELTLLGSVTAVES